MLPSLSQHGPETGLLQKPWQSLHWRPPANADESHALAVHFGAPSTTDIGTRLSHSAAIKRPLSSVCVYADYNGPTWHDFSASALTSFVDIESQIRAYFADYREAPHEADVAAVVAAAKYAAALGCTDAEVYVAACRAQAIAFRALRWRTERSGADEPAAWLARVLQEGKVRQLLDAPDAEHDITSWLPRMDMARHAFTFTFTPTLTLTFTPTSMLTLALTLALTLNLTCILTLNPTLTLNFLTHTHPHSCGITLGHLYTLYRKLSAGLAKELGRPAAFVLYTFLYHLAGSSMLSPSRQSEKVLKSLYVRVGRQVSSHEEERKRACKRRDQNHARGSTEAYYHACAEVRMLDRLTHLGLGPAEVLHFMPESIAEKENPPQVVRPPCLKRPREWEWCMRDRLPCLICEWPGAADCFHCGAEVGMCLLCSEGVSCGAELLADGSASDREEYPILRDWKEWM